MKPLTSHDADRIAEQVAHTGQRLARRTGRTTALAATAQRAATWTPGITSPLGKEGGGQPGGVSDPTGQAVAAERYDPTNRWVIELALAARKVEALLLLLEKIMGRIDGHDSPRPRDQTKRCSNLACATIIETSTTDLAAHEWCPPCYSYRLRNDGRDAPHDVIEARERQRRKRGKVDA